GHYTRISVYTETDPSLYGYRIFDPRFVECSLEMERTPTGGQTHAPRRFRCDHWADSPAPPDPARQPPARASAAPRGQARASFAPTKLGKVDAPSCAIASASRHPGQGRDDEETAISCGMDFGGPARLRFRKNQRWGERNGRERTDKCRFADLEFQTARA